MTDKEISQKRERELKEEILPWLKAKADIDIIVAQNKSRFEKSKLLISDYFTSNGKEFNFEDWKWQLKNRFTTIEELDFFFRFSDQKKEELKQVTYKYRFSITPYYLALINPENDADPLKKMSLVSSDELIEGGNPDPMQEAQTNPCGIITRRYPDRLILNITNTCAMHCRQCQRRRKFGDKDKIASPDDVKISIDYINQNPEIRDVLITGGDPLTLSDNYIDNLLGKIRRISHVDIIRIGTRVPVTMPQRITPELISILERYSPLYINTQFNHPVEITEESTSACSLLANSGIILGNQMVFLKGINDNKYIVKYLNQKLLQIRVRPYYIHHPQRIMGTSHFYVPIEEGLSIMKYLKGNGITSGFAIPAYILNAPKGLGKMRLPDAIVEITEDNLLTETWEGKRIKYNLPDVFYNNPIIINE